MLNHQNAFFIFTRHIAYFKQDFNFIDHGTMTKTKFLVFFAFPLCVCLCRTAFGEQAEFR